MQYTDCPHCGTQHDAHGRSYRCQSCGGPLHFEEETPVVWNVTINQLVESIKSAESVKDVKKRREDEMAHTISAVIVLVLVLYALFIY